MNGRRTFGLVVVLIAGIAGRAGAAAPDAATQGPEACVGLMLPSVIGAAGDATAIATGIRELLASYLTGPSVRTLAIDARLTSLAVEEARMKSCGHVLVVKVTQQRREGGGGLLGRTIGRAAQSAAIYTPTGSAAGAIARGTVLTSGEALTALSESTKAKDEFRMEYTLLRTEATSPPSAPSEYVGKAKRDGEDVITPIVERIAEAVVAAVNARR
jgi:hypothetical protein